MVVAVAAAATVVRRATCRRSAPSLRTCPRCSAATVTSSVILAGSVPSRVTASFACRLRILLSANKIADSRVKCSNCQEMGHTKVRCKQPLVPEADDAGGFGGNDAGGEPAANDDGGSSWPATGDTAAIDATSAW